MTESSENKKTNVIIVAALAVCILSVFFYIYSLLGFNEFIPSNGRYKIVLPGNATERMDSNMGIDISTVLATYRSYNLTITSWDYPGNSLSHSEKVAFLEQMKMRMVVKQSIIDYKAVKLLGHPGFALIMKDFNNIFSIVKLYFIKDTIYQQIATGEESILENKRVEEIVESFEIINP